MRLTKATGILKAYRGVYSRKFIISLVVIQSVQFESNPFEVPY
jgi:hypothetical protein